jgi:hypothetical protein
MVVHSAISLPAEVVLVAEVLADLAAEALAAVAPEEAGNSGQKKYKKWGEGLILHPIFFSFRN